MKKNSKLLVVMAMIFIAGIFLLSGCNKAPDQKHIVPLATAKRNITFFRNLIPSANDTGIADARTRSFFYRSEAFTKSDLEAILSESGCDGIRIYHAVNEKGRSVMYIVGKNSTGNDLLPDSTARNPAAAQVDNKGNYIINSDVPCPEMCPANGF